MSRRKRFCGPRAKQANRVAPGYTLLVIGLFGVGSCAAQTTQFKFTQYSCPLDVACFCGDSTLNISHRTIEACLHEQVLNCTLCQPGNASLEGGLHCHPFDRQCILYGTPTAEALKNRVAPGYTLFVQGLGSNITSTVTLNSTSIQLLGDLTIIGVDPVNATCPLIFEGPLAGGAPPRLTLINLTLHCVNNTHPAKPGVLIQNVQNIEINATNVTVTRHAQSAITVLGGLQDGMPSELHVNLGETTLAGVALLDSYMRMWVDVTLAMYYTSSDRGIACDVGRLMVQPALDPKKDYASPITVTDSTIVYNLTEWTRIFGVDYEVIVNDDASLGFELTETSKEQQTLIAVGWGITAAATAIIVLRYSGPVYYLYKLSKVI